MEVFWFLVRQQSNQNISRQLRKRTKQIVSYVNEFMETKLGPIRDDEVRQSNKSNSSEGFLLEFKEILARLTPTTIKKILAEIKDAMNGMSLLLTKPLLRQMAVVMVEQAIAHPYLIVSIIEVCEELQQRQNVLMTKMKSFILKQFDNCWVEEKLVASFDSVAAIQSCLVELLARDHINEDVLSRKIYRFLISFETDKAATLPVLFDFVQKVKPVLLRVKKMYQVQSALKFVKETLREELKNLHSDELIKEIRKTLKLLETCSQQDIEGDDDNAESDEKSIASNWDDTDKEESNPSFEQHELNQELAAISLEPKSINKRSTEDISEHRMHLCINDIHDRATADFAHVSEYSKLCENPSSFFDDTAKIACFQKKHFEVSRLNWFLNKSLILKHLSQQLYHQN